MESLVLILNIILAILLIGFVLLQKSEGGALGLGASQESFVSSRSAGSFLTKSTAIIATLFIISSISIVILSRGDLVDTQSVIDKIENSDIDVLNYNNSDNINTIIIKTNKHSLRNLCCLPSCSC